MALEQSHSQLSAELEQYKDMNRDLKVPWLAAFHCPHDCVGPH